MSPWVQGLRFASVGAEQTSPGRLATHLPQDFGCCGAGAPWFKVSPPARSARGMRSPGPHSVSAPVVAEQTSPGRLATHLPRGYGCGRAGAHGSKVSASVVTEQTSTGRLATHLPQGYGCCGAGALY